MIAKISSQNTFNMCLNFALFSLAGASHRLNQCWLTAYWILASNFYWNFNQYKIFSIWFRKSCLHNSGHLVSASIGWALRNTLQVGVCSETNVRGCDGHYKRQMIFTQTACVLLLDIKNKTSNKWTKTPTIYYTMWKLTIVRTIAMATTWRWPKYVGITVCKES